MNPTNQDVAGRLEEAAKLLGDQGADRYRVAAYLRAASSVRSTQTPVDAVLRDRGLDGLKQLPHVGETIARAIREWSRTDDCRCWIDCAAKPIP